MKKKTALPILLTLVLTVLFIMPKNVFAYAYFCDDAYTDNNVCVYEKKIHLIKDKVYKSGIEISENAYAVKVTSIKSSDKNLKIRTENVGKTNKWSTAYDTYEGTNPCEFQLYSDKTGEYSITFKVKYKQDLYDNWKSAKYTIKVYVTKDEAIKKFSIGGKTLTDVNNGWYESHYLSKKAKGKIHIEMGKGYKLVKIKNRGDLSSKDDCVSHHSSGGKAATLKNDQTIYLNNKCSGKKEYERNDYLKNDDGTYKEVTKTQTEVFDYPLAETELEVTYKDIYTNRLVHWNVYVYVEIK
ncbi:MAG: hypothetical protein K6E13_11515 [Lachnospiraceae bacterium]|nr:hypothetical protein [Lachnospiraceae bacterium]